MKTLKLLSLAFALALSSLGIAEAKLKIVATTPDLADIARRVGGDLVQVDTLAKGTEDIHAVPMKPSFIPKLAKADGVVHIGFWAEHAFLPALIDASTNPSLQPKKKGDIDCSVYVTPVGVPLVMSRAEGDLHPDGNPHYNIDPRKGALISQAIEEGYSRLDPANAPIYKKNKESFDRELEIKMKEWRQKAAKTKDVGVVSYHKDMVYLADFLGMKNIGEIEPKPGIAPSPRHLEELAEKMKNENVKLILLEIQYSDKTPRWLAERTGAKIAHVAAMGGAYPGTETYFGMIDQNINSIVQALP